MKKLLLLTISMLVGMVAAQAQEVAAATTDDEVNLTVVKPAVPSQETEAQRKAHEKEMRAQVNLLAHDKAIQAMEQGYFVVMADRISSGRTGYTSTGLSDNANFLLRQGDAGIFQVAYLRGNPGANGLGGMTLHGSVKGVKIKENKDGTVNMTYNMSSYQMNAYISIHLYKDCDRVMVDVNPTMGSNRITLYGRLVPYRNPKIQIDK